MEDNEEESVGECVHRERLDEPVGNPGHKEPFGRLADGLDALEVDLHHHRVDHEPDQDGNRDGDAVDLQCREKGRYGGQEMADGDANDHAEQHPDGQVALKEVDATHLFMLHRKHLWINR